MKTIRRLLYRDIVASVLFVSLAFLSLFFFIDFVEELDAAGSRGRGAWVAVQASTLEIPGHFYEVFPIAVLIGTIYALARMAQSSEFTILRTGGLGPGLALALLAALGLLFAVVTWLVGDYVAPASARQAVLLKARTTGGLRLEGAGAWLKERRSSAAGERSYAVNVAGATAAGAMQGIRIFEFDADGRLMSRTEAREGRVVNEGVAKGGGLWQLSDVAVTSWPAARSPQQTPVVVQRHSSLNWPSTLSAEVVSAAVLPIDTMTTLELWRYSQHLNSQEQAAQGHQIRFWRKALYPLACVVMVALALPFAYLHARAGGISLKVFGGIMLGISFVLLNNLSGHMGVLRGWSPWVAAATPSLAYLLLSMGAFAWLVRYR
jgi:lipopolysaccharide export system permease protein